MGDERREEERGFYLDAAGLYYEPKNERGKRI